MNFWVISILDRAIGQQEGVWCENYVPVQCPWSFSLESWHSLEDIKAVELKETDLAVAFLGS